MIILEYSQNYFQNIPKIILTFSGAEAMMGVSTYGRGFCSGHNGAGGAFEVWAGVCKYDAGEG